MPLPKKNRLLLLCLLLTCCQKIDLTDESQELQEAGDESSAVSIIGTGEGTRWCPYSVEDILSLDLPEGEGVWVIGYMVGTARQTMNNAVFSASADNRSNILLSSDSLCQDASLCIPIELSSEKNRAAFSLPSNVAHFRQCLLIQGCPSKYLNRKGLKRVSSGLWLDGFDVSKVAPAVWGTITW